MFATNNVWKFLCGPSFPRILYYLVQDSRVIWSHTSTNQKDFFSLGSAGKKKNWGGFGSRAVFNQQSRLTSSSKSSLKSTHYDPILRPVHVPLMLVVKPSQKTVASQKIRLLKSPFSFSSSSSPYNYLQNLRYPLTSSFLSNPTRILIPCPIDDL